MSTSDGDPTARGRDAIGPATVGLVGIGGWIAGELLLRRGGVPLLAEPLGTAGGADMLLVGLGFPLLAAGIALVGFRGGIARTDWGYDWSHRALLAGVGGILVYYVAIIASALVYVAVVGMPSVPVPTVGTAQPRWVGAVFLVANGMVVPIAEELAWRGVVQTSLVRRFGPEIGIAVTAAAFVAKHLLVDMAAPTFRVVSLVVLAVVFSLLRHRYGTGSSTVAHLGVNLTASASVVL